MSEEILLIDPPFQRFVDYEEGGFAKEGIPIGLLSLAGNLKRDVHRVSVWDSDYNPHGRFLSFVPKVEHFQDWLEHSKDKNHPIWKEVASKIEELAPSTVGISMVSTKYNSGLLVAEIAKELGVERVIVGGPHATLRPDDILKSKYVDSVVKGEGELVFNRAMEEDGIITAERIRDLDSLAWPARDTLVGLENYEAADLGYMMTSRGCPGGCNYCCSQALWGKTVRMRDIKDVLAELDHAHREHGVNKFYLLDDTFTMGEERVAKFCDGVRDREYEWSCLTRVDCLTESMLENMASSGCSLIKFGFESGSQRILDLMNKGTTVEQAEQAADLANKYGIPWKAYIMAGVPGETDADVDMTMALVERTQPWNVSPAHFTPYFGTPFWDQINGGEQDFDYAAANHHSPNVLAGDVSRRKMMEFFEKSDAYNVRASVAHRTPSAD